MRIAAIHAGEHLAEELAALEPSSVELARKLNVPTCRVTQMLNGTRLTATPRSAWRISSARLRSSGSICKPRMISAWPNKRLASARLLGQISYGTRELVVHL